MDSSITYFPLSKAFGVKKNRYFFSRKQKLYYMKVSLQMGNDLLENAMQTCQHHRHAVTFYVRFETFRMNIVNVVFLINKSSSTYLTLSTIQLNWIPGLVFANNAAKIWMGRQNTSDKIVKHVTRTWIMH